MWEGIEVPLVLNDGLWRARKRSRELTVNIATGTPDLPQAKRIVKAELERLKQERPKAPDGTLEDLVKAYLATPKRASEDVATANVQRLRSVVRTAWGRELKKVPLEDLPKLWPAYVAKRQRRAVPDYNTRNAGNSGINSAMRMARSLLIDQLVPAYEAAGLVLPANAANVIWCAELYTTKPVASDTGMIEAWRELPAGSPLWWTIGLARFAGLRRSEILAMRGKWAVPRGLGVVVELRDRPEDKYWTKTGRPYSALVMDPGLADALRAVQPEGMIIAEPDAERWIEREPQAWLAPFVNGARLPLHRLRGLYADQVKRETEEAILARQKGLKAASEALGHTSTATTERHYTTPD